MIPISILAIFTNAVIFMASFVTVYVISKRYLSSARTVWLASLLCAIVCVMVFHPSRPVLDEFSIGLAPIDTEAGATPRPPSTVDQDMYNGQAYDLRAPDVMRAGSLVDGTVTIHNASNLRWPTRGSYSVKVGYQFVYQNGDVAAEGRTLLFPDIAPTETRIVPLSLRAPDKRGVYTLKVGPLFEAITWFDSAGGTSAKMEVRVQ
jgi:hypothetical protein